MTPCRHCNTTRRCRCERQYHERGDSMLAGVDMTPPFPSQQRLNELAGILAQQYFLPRVPQSIDTKQKEGDK